MGKISVDYDKCTSISSSLENARSYAGIDHDYLRNALSKASGCFGDPSGEIRSAMTSIDNFKQDILDFKRSFNSLISDIKATDINYELEFTQVDDIINNGVSNFFNITTSGTNGGIGVARDIIRSVNSTCYIELLPSGKVRVVGDSIARANNGVKAGGATYRIGSDSYVAAGLDKYVVKGASASEFGEKYISNLKQTTSKSVNNFRMNPGECVRSFGKSTFCFQSGDTFGNLAKGLSYAAIAYEAGTDTYNNIQNGASGSKIAADVTVDVAKGLGGMAVATACANVGAAIGTAIPIPVVGTVVGAALGFAAGYAGAWLYNTLIDGVEIKGKTVAEWASTGIENAIDAVGDGLSKAADAVGDFFSGIGSFAFG